MASEPSDSAQIAKILQDTKVEAVQLKHDSADLEAFVKSGLTWETFAKKADMIREHVNNTGKLLVKLHEAEPAGSSWQREAIEQIDPLLKELAANTEATINTSQRTQVEDSLQPVPGVRASEL
jgi:hypothetical protein